MLFPSFSVNVSQLINFYNVPDFRKLYTWKLVFKVYINTTNQLSKLRLVLDD